MRSRRCTLSLEPQARRRSRGGCYRFDIFSALSCDREDTHHTHTHIRTRVPHNVVMMAAVNQSSSGLGGGLLARTAGDPTNVSGNTLSAPGAAGFPAPQVGTIKEARNNRGSNEKVPYARLVPMRPSDQIGPLAPLPAEPRREAQAGLHRKYCQVGIRGPEVGRTCLGARNDDPQLPKHVRQWQRVPVGDRGPGAARGRLPIWHRPRPISAPCEHELGRAGTSITPLVTTKSCFLACLWQILILWRLKTCSTLPSWASLAAP